MAPTLVPKRAGDKVKTDRRDALLLARGYRAGDLSAVWVPDAEHEAMREIVRCREAAKADQLRARHRLSKLLLRHGIRPPKGIKNWSKRHELWLQTVRFEQKKRSAKSTRATTLTPDLGEWPETTTAIPKAIE